MSKIFSSKTLALVLSVVMVVCAFAANFSVSADETNLLAGLSYTYTMNAFWSGGEDADGTLLTDGSYRGDGTVAFNGNSGVNGTTVELAGTYAENKVEFAFDEATSIGTIVIKNARAYFQNQGVNRHCKVAAVQVTADGLNYTDVAFTAAYAGVEGAPLYAVEEGGEEFDQYFDITITVTGATDVMGLSLTLTTERDDGSYAYIVQLDEIEAYAGDAPVAPESSEAPVAPESSEAPVVPESSEEPSEEESSEDVVIAETTYKVTITDNGDGTVSVVATVPAGVESGKIVFSVSSDLTYVPGSIKGDVGGSVLNETYNRKGVVGIANAYAAIAANAEGTVALSATYTVAEGATVDASDVTVPEWSLTIAGVKAGTQADGDVEKVFVPFETEEPSVEEPSSAAPSVDTPDEPSVDTTEEPSVDTTVDTTEETTEDTTEETSVVEDSSSTDKPAPGTGDAGLAVFAVLAVLSGAAVVVLKKRA